MELIQTFPQRVPLKVIGRQSELRPEMVLALILEHLGPQDEADQRHGANCKGDYVSLTFWVVLPHAEAERPLREAISKLPGYQMQL
jgi:putative lipoic acid-binding regulatory protein